jgi:hypothetical protein
LQLVLRNEASEYVLVRGLRRNTGTCGLRSELAQAIEPAAFETFSAQRGKKATINVVNGKLTCGIT